MKLYLHNHTKTDSAEERRKRNRKLIEIGELLEILLETIQTDVNDKSAVTSSMGETPWRQISCYEQSIPTTAGSDRVKTHSGSGTRVAWRLKSM